MERILFPGCAGKKITSFETVNLRLTGMRGSSEYEVIAKNGNAEVSFYQIRRENQEDRRVLEKRASCREETILKLLNDCRVLSWDGFQGAHPRFVRDGIMFDLNAAVNDGIRIQANGSENFPKHFREFTAGLREVLDEAEEEKTSRPE